MLAEIRSNRLFFALYLLSLAAAALLGTIATLASELLKLLFFPDGAGWLGLLVACLVLAVPLFFITRAGAKRAGEILGASVKVSRQDRQEALPFLLMGYSPLSPKMPVSSLLAELEALRPANVALPSAAYAAACKVAGRDPLVQPWQQNLRAAWHHRGKLAAIYVLDPDEDQFENLKSYLSIALKTECPKLEVIRITDPERPGQPFATVDDMGHTISPSYENYTYNYEGLLRGIAMIGQRPDARALAAGAPKRSWLSGSGPQEALDRLICVDATSGLKIFSVAAAVLTLNRPLKFSYVATFGKHGGEVGFYDTNLKIAGAGG